MKKTVLIVGALALVGVGAYMFLQNKKKEEAILGGGSSATPSGTTPSGTTPSGTTPSGTTPSGTTTTPTGTSVANDGGLAPITVSGVAYGESDIDLQKAKEIVRKMLKGKEWDKIKESTLKSINLKLSKLGYVYQKGNIIKI
jgi:hypothetical protein